MGTPRHPPYQRLGATAARQRSCARAPGSSRGRHGRSDSGASSKTWSSGRSRRSRRTAHSRTAKWATAFWSLQAVRCRGGARWAGLGGDKACVDDRVTARARACMHFGARAGRNGQRRENCLMALPTPKGPKSSLPVACSPPPPRHSLSMKRKSGSPPCLHHARRTARQHDRWVGCCAL